MLSMPSGSKRLVPLLRPQKYFWVIQFDFRRDAAREPIVHPLDAAMFFIAEQLSDLCWATELFNQQLIFGVFGHADNRIGQQIAVIKHHV